VRAQLTTETWAGTGRIVTVSMYPVSERELRGALDPDRASFLTRLAASGLDDLSVPPDPPVIDDYISLALRGGFPEITYLERSARTRAVWLESYIDNLVTRDAAIADTAKDPVKLRRYLSVLALNNAGLPSEATIYRATPRRQPATTASWPTSSCSMQYPPGPTTDSLGSSNTPSAT
jgi:predicted AAA+ superfamily ATPase